MNWKLTNRKKATLVMIAVTIAVYLGMKYLLPLVIPFLAALFLARFMQPLIRKIRKRLKINSGLLAGIFLLIAGGLLFFLLFLLTEKLISQIVYLLNHLSLYESRLRNILYGCCCSLEDWIKIPAEQLQNIILENITVFIENLQVNLIPRIMNQSVNYIRIFVEILGVVLITVISTILIAKDFDKLKECNSKYIYYRYIQNLGHHLMAAGGSYLKAQLLIMTIIAVICTLGLLLLRNPYALLAGIGIGLLDALPVFGTGSVLIPWVIIELLRGNFFQVAILFTIYIICSCTREFLESKLIGDKLGFPPIVIIITIYIGLKLFGITGVFLGPISLLLIGEIVREIFIHYNLSLKK